jgi:hypothetical protein
LGHGLHHALEIRWDQFKVRLQVQHLASPQDEVHHRGEAARGLQVHRGANAQAAMALG